MSAWPDRPNLARFARVALLADEIRSLEEALLTRGVRGSAAELGRLLADDFVEFGSSGRIYTRAEALSALAAAPSSGEAAAPLTDFNIRELAPHVVLATYRSGQSLRSSLWRREAGGWRVAFHQGTRLPG